MNTYPLISCICIAHDRPAFFNKAFECFEEQNYPNKELVVAYHKKDYHTQSIISKFIDQNDAKIIGVPYCFKNLPDEIIRQAILKSTGLYICNWNENGWHHKSRLSYQYNSMQIVGERFQASILSRIWIHDYHHNRSYLSQIAWWDETLLCKKETLIASWDTVEQKGLSIDLIHSLSAKKILYFIDKMPSLYIQAYRNEELTSPLDEELNQKILEFLR